MNRHQRYNRSEAGRARRARYAASDKGIRTMEKHRGWGGVRTQRARAARIAEHKGDTA